MFVMYTSLCCMLSAIIEEAASLRPFIKASDVVFMYPVEDPSQYDAYSGTVVGWAGRPRTRNVQDVRFAHQRLRLMVEAFRRRVEEGHKRGMRYCGSDDFLVDFRGFIDFRPDNFMDAACRDLDSNPIRVPWLWDHEYMRSLGWCAHG